MNHNERFYTPASTYLKDCNGETIFEGDYVALKCNNANSQFCGNVGRVFWDQRRKSWQVVTMILPARDCRPDLWGQACADWLNKHTAENYEVLETRGFNDLGDWTPKSFYSGGMIIPLTHQADNAVYISPAEQNKKPADESEHKNK